MITLHEGDNRITLRRLINEGVRVHAVVTDPPYGLTSIAKRFGKEGAAPARTEKNDGSFARLSGGFMGKAWDGTGIERDPEFWRLIWEILLPGGYCFAFSGSRTGHWQAVAMEQAGFVMHPMHGWVFGCMDPETECLTKRGWLPYTDLLPTDEVLQWDSEADTLSWIVPEALHEYDFDGEMVQIKNRHTHQVLTPNHRVYAKVRRHSRHPKPSDYEVVQASEIQQRPANWQVNLPMASHLQGTLAVNPTYAYLVGWWLTDAWPRKDANACCFSQSKPATLVKLRAALEGLGAREYVKTARHENHSDEHTFYLTGEMAHRLRGEFPNRKLGWEVLQWTIDARRALYEGLMDGDGSREKAGQIAEAFWSQQQDRRDVFLALALSIGIRCYEDPVKGVVYVNKKTRTTQVQDKQRAEPLPYKGKVWCLTVPTGAFVVRRSGRPFITGNSGFPKAHSAREAGPEWEGWAYGTQTQKPALEPIYLGQKPFSEKTGIKNVQKHGVGAVNIDGCRVPTEDNLNGGAYAQNPTEREAMWGEEAGNSWRRGGAGEYQQPAGRHPANLIHDGSAEVVALFPKGASGKPGVRRKDHETHSMSGRLGTTGEVEVGYGDSGSSARFFNCFPLTEEDYRLAIEAGVIGEDLGDPIFYNPKAGKEDRAGGKHPTVKPVALMQHLIRHVTPPGGVILDPFAGSGTTAEAARREGFECVLMEAEPEYIEFLKQRFKIEDDEDFDLLSDTKKVNNTPTVEFDPLSELLG